MLRILLSASTSAWLLTPSLAHGQDPSGTEGDFSFSGVTYPSLAGAFRVTQAMRWDDPEAGVQLTYAPEGIAGAYNVYVYPGQDDLEKEVAVALQGMFMSANRVGQEISVDSTRTVEVAGLEGELVVTRISANGRASRSLIYVFNKGSSVIKYRITYEPALRNVLEDRLDEFLRVTLTSIRSIWE